MNDEISQTEIGRPKVNGNCQTRRCSPGACLLTIKVPVICLPACLSSLQTYLSILQSVPLKFRAQIVSLKNDSAAALAETLKNESPVTPCTLVRFAKCDT
jgi:hypothetical protein